MSLIISFIAAMTLPPVVHQEQLSFLYQDGFELNQFGQFCASRNYYIAPKFSMGVFSVRIMDCSEEMERKLVKDYKDFCGIDLYKKRNDRIVLPFKFATVKPDIPILASDFALQFDSKSMVGISLKYLMTKERISPSQIIVECKYANRALFTDDLKLTEGVTGHFVVRSKNENREVSFYMIQGGNPGP